MVKKITRTRSKKAKDPRNDNVRPPEASESKVELENAQQPKISRGVYLRRKGMELRNKHKTSK